MPLSFFPTAVPTAIGWAHPLTGEQLTAGAIDDAELDGETPVAYYKPNAKDKSFLDPEGVTRNLIFAVPEGHRVNFAIHSLDPIASVAWNFGDRGVASTTVTAGGTGYIAPFVSFANAPSGGVNATGTATVEDGVITEIVITNPGAGYTSAPAITIDGGVTAEGTCEITGDEVTSASITNTGYGYATAPTVTFTGGGGTGAAATADLIDGQVYTLTITNGGSGYTTAPTVTISPAPGQGATATCTLTAATVTAGPVTRHGYQNDGTYDISAVVSYVGGTPSNVTLNITDLDVGEVIQT